MLQDVYFTLQLELQARRGCYMSNGTLTGVCFHAIPITLRLDEKMNEAETDAQHNTGRRPGLMRGGERLENCSEGELYVYVGLGGWERMLIFRSCSSTYRCQSQGFGFRAGGRAGELDVSAGVYPSCMNSRYPYTYWFYLLFYLLSCISRRNIKPTPADKQMPLPLGIVLALQSPPSLPRFIRHGAAGDDLERTGDGMILGIMHQRGCVLWSLGRIFRGLVERGNSVRYGSGDYS